MSDRVVVFLDWQNVYKGAREAFCGYGAPHWEGQVHPLALGHIIAADSPYDRQLRQVRVYRGQPDATRDPRGYAANARQVATWRQSPLVDMTMRTLRYPRGWPTSHQPGEKPQEKGIDVALAIDFVSMAVAGEFEVGVLMSTDTDLKPRPGGGRAADAHAGHQGGSSVVEFTCRPQQTAVDRFPAYVLSLAWQGRVRPDH